MRKQSVVPPTRRRRLCAITVAAAFFLLAFLVPVYGRNPAGSSTTSHFQVLVKDGQLSLTADDVPLSRILEEISGQANIPIILNENVGDMVRSFQLRNVSLLEGLHNVLQDCDSFFLYSPEPGKSAQITAVWVYPAGHGRTLAPVAAKQILPLSEIEHDLRDSDPQIRAKAVAAMIDRGGRRALDAVVRALNDPNADVRSETLYAAWAANLQLPETTLQMLALGDGSPTVRFLALQSLPETPAARQVAEHALQDPDVNVQNEARAVLSQLNSKVN